MSALVVDWFVLPEHLESRIERVLQRQGYRPVRNDLWLRRALRLWNKRKRVYNFYFQPKTKVTIVVMVWLYMGTWVVRLGVVRRK